MKPPADIQDRFRRGLDVEMDRRWEACSLVEWLRTHRAEATEVLNHMRLNWKVAAELFEKKGLKDGLGQAPSAETAREAWLRVEGRRQAGMAMRKKP